MILSKLKIHNCVFAGDRPPVESECWKGRETFYGSPSSITPLRNLSSKPTSEKPLVINTSEKPLVNPNCERPLVNPTLGKTSVSETPLVSSLSLDANCERSCTRSPTSPKSHSCESHLIHKRHISWKPVSERGILESLGAWLLVREVGWRISENFYLPNPWPDNAAKQSHWKDTRKQSEPKYVDHVETSTTSFLSKQPI